MDHRAVLDLIKFKGISKDLKQIRSKSSLNNKINLFEICKKSTDLRQFNRMIKEQYSHKINLIKCSRLESLSQLQETDNSIIILHEMYQSEVIELLGEIQPLIIIYNNDLNTMSNSQLNSTFVCFVSKQQKALIKYFKQLLSKPFGNLRMQLQNKQKYEQCLTKLPKLLAKITASSRVAPGLGSISAKYMNDSWKYPSPTKYSPNTKGVSSRKMKPKLVPLQKQKS